MFYGVLTSVTYNIFKKSVDNTSNKIFDNIKDIIKLNKDVSIIIDNYDIKDKINIFKIFLNEFNNNSKTIYLALSNIYQVILVIDTLLYKIKKITDKHQEKIFYKYRIPDYGNKLDKLEKYMNILDKRFDFLVKLSIVLNNK